MASTKAVGIRELKNNLSAYLREVKGGLRVLVLDRDEMVAELHQPGSATAKMLANPILLEWANNGLITLPRPGKKQKCPPSPLHSPDGTANRLLTEDRGE